MPDLVITAKEVKVIEPDRKSALIYIHLELLFVIIIWAGTFVSTKIVLEQLTPTVAAVYRYLIASVILLVLNSRKKEKVAKKDYPAFFLLGLTGVTLYYLLQNYGIKYTNAIDAAILISLSPVFIGLISWVFLKETIKSKAVCGLILALVGSLLVVTNGKFVWGGIKGQFLGNLLILLTAVSWAIYSVYGKKLLGHYNTLTLITYTTLIGTALLIPFSLMEFISTGFQEINWLGWLNLIYLGGAASVYGYLAWYRALKRLPAITVGSYLYFRPLLTGIIAAIVLDERVGLFVILGGLLIIIGTYMSAKLNNNKSQTIKTRLKRLTACVG